MSDFETAFGKQRVLVTGHTGFCGSWLTLWLRRLGAEVMGVSLKPESSPALFTEAGLKSQVRHREIDICDMQKLSSEIADFQPAFVFHLAAQALVRRSYRDPIDTFRVNALGTACLLEACRPVKSVRAAVLITTDKVYENREWAWAYRENDALGGKDPYSASKACAELVAASYRRALIPGANGMAVATARGGNIIGGGDWSEDRLIPDLVRAISSKTPITIRNPKSTRPWQHVLCLCHGYLQLADQMTRPGGKVSEAYNFGPSGEDVLPVEDVLARFAQSWRPVPVVHQPDAGMPEAGMLSIDSARAQRELGWRPGWSGAEGIARAAEWYAGYYDRKETAASLCGKQIEAYRETIG